MEKKITSDGKVIDKIIPIAGIRKMVARHMEESLRTSPQVTGSVKVDVSRFVNLRNSLKAQGMPATYTEMFAKMTATAVQKVPVINSSRQGNKMEIYSSVNIGIAVANKKNQVLVPVVRDVQSKSLVELSKEIRALAEKVRDNTIQPEEMVGGTISISSMGMFNVDTFTPILNMPQAAIIGLGRIRQEPCVDEVGAIVVRPMMHFSVTADHAIIDGVPHAEFITKLAEGLYKPEEYLDL
ncbi:Dihydrolipoyllysine-residue acetyltransferase component of pyruvate dehydrogenase complex [anaerobic digester metagenome]